METQIRGLRRNQENVNSEAKVAMSTVFLRKCTVHYPTSHIKETCSNPLALLTGILPQDIYTAVCKAVDEKLSTYNFQEDSFTKLSDKRLQRMCNYVKKQTKLDVATHLVHTNLKSWHE